MSDEERIALLTWAKRHSYAENMFVSFVSHFNSKIYIDLGFHSRLRSIRVRSDRSASRFSKWLFGPYEWREVSLDEDGPWWDDVRNDLPKLVELDKVNDEARRLKRKLELDKLAEKYRE